MRENKTIIISNNLNRIIHNFKSANKYLEFILKINY